MPCAAGAGRALPAGLCEASRVPRGGGAAAGAAEGDERNAPQASQRVKPSGSRSPQRGQVMLASVAMTAV